MAAGQFEPYFQPLVRLADVVTARGSSDRPLSVIDLALPHDVDPSVADLPGVDLVNTLNNGDFTVFAPVNAAFAALPAGTVDTLLKPENKATLTSILTYHVVSGALDAKALDKQVKAGHGKATLTTVQGEKLTVTEKGKKVMVTDAKGNVANVTIANVYQSNGIIHVIDKVLMP